MSKLQSNFTTPEQSKRLLELGVPADSADCYNIINNDVYNKDDIRVRQNDYEINYSFFNNKHYNPCWSVGRLMNIFDICCAISDYNDWFNTQCVPNEYVAYIIGCYERAIDSKMLDFSKLEE